MSNTELKTAKERAEEIRKSKTYRRPLDGRVGRFPTLPEREGFRCHWFNDVDGRVEAALGKGWEFSKRAGYTDNKVDLAKEPNKRIKIRCGTKDDGSDMYAYAMDIPLEIWQDYREQSAKPQKTRMKYILEGKTEASGLEGTDAAPKANAQISTQFKID